MDYLISLGRIRRSKATPAAHVAHVLLYCVSSKRTPVRRYDQLVSDRERGGLSMPSTLARQKDICTLSYDCATNVLLRRRRSHDQVLRMKRQGSPPFCGADNRNNQEGDHSCGHAGFKMWLCQRVARLAGCSGDMKGLNCVSKCYGQAQRQLVYLCPSSSRSHHSAFPAVQAMMLGALVLTVALSLQVLAAPTPIEVEQRADSSVTVINAATIASYAPYTNFAAATYCPGVADWSCKACKRVPGFIPYATGGNGNDVQYCNLSVLTDTNAFFGTLSTSLFPGVTSAVQVHSGFRDAHAATAATILAAVKKVIAERSATKVTLVGHSLGGALAALDALYLKLNLASTIAIKAVTYGQPRVGNQEFADLFQQKITDYSRITNIEDEIPIVPGRFLGYHHSSGEKHIKYTGDWRACAGQDNTSEDCIVGSVPTLLQGNLIDHLGPYEGVWIGTLSC
ncbi:lipase domain-containing protein [Rhizoctonia solani AG-1 IA]|uniref:Lipase domain-containing protein n=1 Tax=Thanatephorus cucumeris (strain AG1-IA) TaxID=983506 RepID=L8X4V5_THACA|nr:lipase domain-containing protein [Rhizoctonia solani AG-1 IA]